MSTKRGRSIRGGPDDVCGRSLTSCLAEWSDAVVVEGLGPLLEERGSMSELKALRAGADRGCCGRLLSSCSLSLMLSLVLLNALPPSGTSSASTSGSFSASNQVPWWARSNFGDVGDDGDRGLWESKEEQRPETDVAAVVNDCSRVRTTDSSMSNEDSLAESDRSAWYLDSSCSWLVISASVDCSLVGMGDCSPSRMVSGGW